MPSFEPILVVAVLLLLGVLAGKLSSRFGVPALLLFLLLGMLAGSDGPGGIAFTNAPLAAAVGSIALSFIL
ncbi:MAG TPA: potassium/proton antiporter, partial [Acidimicrobiia bacterium]|nr:potassium/proton antiporter [Acidimicrobiia bacterium]